MKTSQLKSKVLALFLAIAGFGALAQAGYGEIRGIITNTDKEPVPFATVKILQGNVLVGGTQSDMEGRYNYKPLTPGIYEMVVIEPGHQTQPINKIHVIPNEATYVDPKLTANTLSMVTVTAKAVDYTRSGVDKNMYTMVSIDAKEIKQNASAVPGDVKGMLVSLSSNVIEQNGEVHVRGSRGDATSYYVDGVRTLGPNTIPGLAIENLTFFSGGVPAMYGDLTSGAVIVTTKSYFSGMREKNIRNQEYRDKQEARRAEEKEKLEAEKRKKEIEEEKAKEKTQ
ncbi:MAG: carboxypeptidase regulatory-like domain-containing protein [Bacteroidetes bacterium]|nr:carboxypeptidase regulatory-like domain-containing protein [Bacteroidota bacterium]